jgi:hypothetical protein
MTILVYDTAKPEHQSVIKDWCVMTVKEIAVKLGYDGIKKHKEKYKGYDVYACILDNPGGEIIGKPVYILVKNGKYRMAKPDEVLDLFDS